MNRQEKVIIFLLLCIAALAITGTFEIAKKDKIIEAKDKELKWYKAATDVLVEGIVMYLGKYPTETASNNIVKLRALSIYQK